MRQPLLAPLAAVAAGVFTARFADFTFFETSTATVALALLAILAYRLSAIRAGIAAASVGFVFAGLTLGSIEAPEDPRRIDRAVAGMDLALPIRLSGVVVEPPQRFEDADRFVLEAERMFGDQPVSGRVRVTVNRPEEDPALELAFGERIEFFARLRELRNYENPGSFDRVRYLHSRGIYMSATVRPYAPLLPVEGAAASETTAWLWQLRKEAKRRFERLTREAGEEGSVGAAVLSAMLLGDRSALERETEIEFQRTGAYHALVVSGLHAGVVALSVFFLFRLVGGPRILEGIVAIACVGAYAVFLEGSLPVARAAWMLAAYVFASHGLYRSRQAPNVIAGVALAFLVADPELLIDAGFQLSFGSVALIAAVAVPILRSTIEPFRRALVDIGNLDRDLHLPVEVVEWRVRMRNWLDPLRKLTFPWVVRGSTFTMTIFCMAAAIVVVSAVLAVGLAVPLAWHFQRVAGGGVGANLVVMPMLAFVIPAGFVALAADSAAVMGAALAGAEAIGTAVSWSAANVPLDVRVPPPPVWLAVLAVGSIAALSWSLQGSERRSKLAGGVALACFALVVIHPVAPDVETGRLELSLVDVGQGEALVVAVPDGRVILIDAGGVPDFGGTRRSSFDIGDSVVSPYLWSRSVRRLYALAVTHPDWDHLGGAFAILENFRVDWLWLPAGVFGDEFAELRAAAQRRGIQVRYLSPGDFELIGGARFEVLESGGSSDERNDRSLTLQVLFGEHEMLLTGDLEQAGELRLAKSLEPTRGGVLKVAHHGSRTSSREPLLTTFRPAFGLISAGYDNLYGHPHAETLERLEAAGSHVLSTSSEGLVSVLTDGRRYEVRTYLRERASRALP